MLLTAGRKTRSAGRIQPRAGATFQALATVREIQYAHRHSNRPQSRKERWPAPQAVGDCEEGHTQCRREIPPWLCLCRCKGIRLPSWRTSRLDEIYLGGYTIR